MDYIYQDQVKCNVKLLNKDLWESFCKLNTEMIITKPGRRMFPSMRVSVTDLDPQKDYCFLVEMVPVTKCRYRYSAASGWAPAGAEEAHSPNRFYMHPESPAPGAHWMSQAVSFGRLKLTNMSNAPVGHVVMASMHKYQPRIHIIEASDIRAAFDYAPKAVVDFIETQFIAVTAYQNDKMTKLKIDHNPFAKGFRESGQSKCKRKRQRMEQARLEHEQQQKLLDEEEQQENLGCTKQIVDSGEEDSIHEEDDVDVVGDDENSQHNLKKPCLATTSLDVSCDSGLSDCDSSLTASPSPINNQQYPQQSFTHLHYQPMFNPFYYHPYPLSYHPMTTLYPTYTQQIHQSLMPSPTIPQDLSTTNKTKQQPRDEEIRPKFTDFSIRAITGLS